MKRAFADRAFWLGDADHVPVPRGLLDPDYLAGLAAGIDARRATPVSSHGTPPRAWSDLFPPAAHTTHTSAADAEGWWVACTSTVNTAFGAKVVVPGTGIVLNNEMDDFVAEPGIPNAFGLVGSAANAILPGKRPLSSMAPTLVLEGERPVMALGAAGGPTIISQVVLAIVRSVDGAADPAAALGAPRIHHQWSPDRLRVEENGTGAGIGGQFVAHPRRARPIVRRDGKAPGRDPRRDAAVVAPRQPAERRHRVEEGVGPEVIAALRARGHDVETTAAIGAATLVARPRADGPFVGAAEPRLEESAFSGR